MYINIETFPFPIFSPKILPVFLEIFQRCSPAWASPKLLPEAPEAPEAVDAAAPEARKSEAGCAPSGSGRQARCGFRSWELITSSGKIWKSGKSGKSDHLINKNWDQNMA